MAALIVLLLNLVASLFKPKSQLEAENAALRQQPPPFYCFKAPSKQAERRTQQSGLNFRHGNPTKLQG
jgi:hypothetical protein